MILSDETLKYPAACYFPPLIHTCTINILPLDEGVNHPNTFIQEQYVLYYTECLMIKVCIMLLEQLLNKIKS
jgi:hypothetical protein